MTEQLADQLTNVLQPHNARAMVEALRSNQLTDAERHLLEAIDARCGAWPTTAEA